MTTQLSLQGLQAVLAQETPEVFLSCLTLTHPNLAVPIRVVNNTQDLVRAAGTFTAYPFEITFPSQEEDRLPQPRLRIDNVDRGILVALRALRGPVTVTLDAVMASSPNTVEAGPFVFSLRGAPYDANAIEGVLGFEDVLNEPFPKDTFTPQLFPGMF